jgi:hypothetical protein
VHLRAPFRISDKCGGFWHFVLKDQDMRAFHGQMSDNQPIRRNQAEKEKQLRDLKETLASMKSHTSPALKESVQRRIKELETELRAAAREKATRVASRTEQPQDQQRQRRAPRRNTIRSM